MMFADVPVDKLRDLDFSRSIDSIIVKVVRHCFDNFFNYDSSSPSFGGGWGEDLR